MKSTKSFSLKAIVFAMVFSQLPLESAPAKNTKEQAESIKNKDGIGQEIVVPVPSIFGKQRSNSNVIIIRN